MHPRPRTAEAAGVLLLALLWPGVHPPAQEAPPPDAWIFEASLDRGLTLKNDALDLRFRLGGRLHLDGYVYDPDNRKPGGVRLQSLVLDLEGSWGDQVDFRLRPDLTGTDAGDRNLRDAWIRYAFTPALRITGGHFKVGFGGEYASSIDDLALPGRSFVSYLNGFYDAGLQVDGILAGDAVYYALSATGGVGYGLEGTRTDDPVFAARIVMRPLRWTSLDWLHGLGFGAALGYSPGFDGRIHLATPLESTVFTTQPFRGERVQRRHLEIFYHRGPFRARYELGWMKIRNVTWAGITDDVDQNTSWMAEAAWAITGETYAFREGQERGLEGVEALDPPSGRFGALEAAARYSNADIDRDLFLRGITTYDPSTQEVRTFTAGLNWYPRSNVRLMLGFVNTIPDHPLTTFRRTTRDRSFVIRLQVDF